MIYKGKEIKGWSSFFRVANIDNLEPEDIKFCRWLFRQGLKWEEEAKEQGFVGVGVISYVQAKLAETNYEDLNL